jgi:hypothetical protein
VSERERASERASVGSEWLLSVDDDDGDLNILSRSLDEL